MSAHTLEELRFPLTGNGMHVPSVYAPLQHHMRHSASECTRCKQMVGIVTIENLSVFKHYKRIFHWVPDHLIDFLPQTFHTIVLQKIHVDNK
jgi:hypothetical protein